MTTSRKLPILLAASAVVLSLFAVAPASAASSVKQKCVSTGTASETFRLKADSASKTQAYKVSVKAKVCLSYTMVSKSVRGKTISQPEVSAVSEELTVSHSGYLPEKNGKAATDLLPRHWGVGRETKVESVMAWAPSGGGTPGFLFRQYSEMNEDYVYLAGGEDGAWAQLVEAGFSCSRGKCRPVKKSATVKYTQALTIPSNSRVFLSTEVGVTVDVTKFDEAIGQYKVSTLYWDNGDPCGTEFATACNAAGVKPVTSFKSERSSLGYYEAWRANATFVGIPSSLRDRS